MCGFSYSGRVRQRCTHSFFEEWLERRGRARGSSRVAAKLVTIELDQEFK